MLSPERKESAAPPHRWVKNPERNWDWMPMYRVDGGRTDARLDAEGISGHSVKHGSWNNAVRHFTCNFGYIA